MSSHSQERLTVLLVHGAWHGAWCWQAVKEELIRNGLEVETVDLPSANPRGGQRGGLHDDARVVRSALDSIDGNVIAVAHSYGGLPLSEGAAGAPNVAHLIYLTAFQLDIGESLWSALGGQPTSWLQIRDDVTMPTDTREIFFADINDVIADAATAKLSPQSLSSFKESQTAAAWKSTPSTYIICENDNAIPVPAQEAMSARAGHSIRLASSHSPFLSRPNDIAQIITDHANSTSAGFTSSAPQILTTAINGD
ncbi:alpha/beta hydrolase [Rhodococcus sp. NPDC127530]|uniref:alpha/beta hydrolase n=1 Tax=unclassified Rhodococcus (in: high G+C Gram-positive bacteria) TaxID=192944 RepID=UPI003625102C